MRKTIFLFMFFLFVLQTQAQKEANIWYFGNRAGLDFNNGSPVAIGDGKMQTLEGCSSISNSNGELLFYTDGILVWDRSHNIMLNGSGLLGDSSSTQSSLVVPKPGSSNIYYIFTVDAVGNPNGFRYSEVDMNLNGGLGGITANKNILLITPISEKITSVKKADDSGYWVLTHGSGNNSFLAYSVTNTGINPAPVISNVGSIVTYGGEMGSIKVSPDGSKLICLHSIVNSQPPYDVNVAVYDFNNQTGVVSNMIALESNGGYGAEFSPSGNVCYIASFSTLFQYDLSAPDLQSSETVIYRMDPDLSTSAGPSSLQLGPDGKIYVSMIYKNYIGVINNPDIFGAGCDFVDNAVPLSPASYCTYGLPQFIQSYFNFSFNTKNLCLRDVTEFTLSNSPLVSSAIWDFGDGFTSTDIKPSHTYSVAGKYHVSVTATKGTETSTKERDVVISLIPSSVQPNDLLICDDNNDGIHTFDLTSQNEAILNGQDLATTSISYFVNGVKIASPEIYSNVFPYMKELVSVEVSNKVNPVCKNTITFNIQVYDTPKPNLPAEISHLIICDNSTVGADNDGRVIFDLTQRETAILNGQSATQFLIFYYKDPSMTQAIALPNVYQNVDSAETIFVKVINKDHLDCSATTSFKIEVLALPVVAKIVDLKQCDEDVDGFSYFNLEEAISKITASSATETITFYESLADAQNNSSPIINKTNYRNQTVSSDKVYVRVANNDNCFSTTQLNLIVSTTQIPSIYSKEFTQCDDDISGTNKDGIASFDFSPVTSEIHNIFPSGQLLDISYYQNIEDALSEKNSIAEISNYRNTVSPNSQKIFIRVDSKLNNDCLGLGGYITLNVEPIPEVKSIKRIHCDDDQDSLFAFDTSNLEQELLNGNTDFTVSYMDQNNSPLPSPLPNPFVTSSQIVKVVVTNNTPTSCSYESTITFKVDDLPQAFDINPALTIACDDETDPALQDGKYAFDTSSFQSTIIGSQTGMTVYYYDTANAQLPSPLPNPFITSTQTIRAEVINPINTNCSAATFLSFVVNPVPEITLRGMELVCSNLPTFTKQIDAGLFDSNTANAYNYIWLLNNNEIQGETSNGLRVNKEGIYTVQVSDKITQCSKTRTINVSASDIAQIQKINIIDLVESNSITISVIGNGDYVFALDDENGTYQGNNVFSDVSAGIHSIYVKDLNGCGIVSKEVAILGIPNYFTPNADGYNDYWNIKGVNTSTNTRTSIDIFDRYGKLLKQISPTSDGWDGTYLSAQMPANDYWYVIKLEDNRIIKGHFALKR